MQLYLPLSKEFCRNPAQSIKCSDLQSDFSLLDSGQCLRFDTEHSRDHTSQNPHVSTSKKSRSELSFGTGTSWHNMVFLCTTKLLSPEIGQLHADSLLGMAPAPTDPRAVPQGLLFAGTEPRWGHHHPGDSTEGDQCCASILNPSPI